MAKSKTKSKTKSGAAKHVSRAGKTVDIAAIRHAITRMVALAAGDMVKAAIEEGKKGHGPALKYLFEMVGLYPATVENEQTEKREMCLAELFCRELGLPMRAADIPERPLDTASGAPDSAVGEHAVE